MKETVHLSLVYADMNVSTKPEEDRDIHVWVTNYKYKNANFTLTVKEAKQLRKVLMIAINELKQGKSEDKGGS